MSSRRWSDADRALLEANWRKTAPELAVLLGRTVAAVTLKREDLGLTHVRPFGRPLIAQTCNECGQLLPAGAFRRRSRDRSPGRVCIDCSLAKIAGFEARNPGVTKRYSQAARRRHQAESLARATRNGFPWTGPELEILSRNDLTRRQQAAMLGRTLAACGRMRAQLLIDPRKIDLAGARKYDPDGGDAA